MPKFDQDSPLYDSLNHHMQKVRERIIRRAEDLTSEGEEVDLPQLTKAVEEFAPGGEFPKRTQPGFLDYFPPLTILSAILAFAFAALGLWATLSSNAAKNNLGGQGFLDIAKIFAGAVVGSTTASMTSLARRGKS
jgi:hypothetical protein